MRFEEFIQSKKVVQKQPDPQKAKALQKTAKNNFSCIKQMELNEVSAAVILVIAYESLRQILEAIAAKEGFHMYSHEAYTSYLEKKGQQASAQKFDRLRKLRNGVNYYGKDISPAVAKETIKTVEDLMKKLQVLL